MNAPGEDLPTVGRLARDIRQPIPEKPPEERGGKGKLEVGRHTMTAGQPEREPARHSNPLNGNEFWSQGGGERRRQEISQGIRQHLGSVALVEDQHFPSASAVIR